MVEKVMLCIECGKLFRSKYVPGEGPACPSCGSSNVDSAYRHYNLQQVF